MTDHRDPTSASWLWVVLCLLQSLAASGSDEPASRPPWSAASRAGATPSVQVSPLPEPSPVGFWSPSTAQELKASADPWEAIDACVAQEMTLTETPGAAIAVAVGGVLAYERGYGVKHRVEGGAVDPHTLFRIGSVTKQLTAAAVLQQVEQGAVSLDDRVTDHVPELELSGRLQAGWIRVRHLLTHSSGFPDTLGWLDVWGDGDDEALARGAAEQGHVRLYAPPGSFYNYSNPGFSLAGLVAERASGTPFRTLMAESVFEPAGMTATTFFGEEARLYGNFSFGHFDNPFTGQPQIVGPDDYDNAWGAPAGFALSNVVDMMRWMLLLMDGGGPVLEPWSAAALQSPQMPTDYFPGFDYGYGVMVEAYQGLTLRHHGGNVPGWGAFLLWVPEEGFAVAVLANSTQSLTDSAMCALHQVLDLPDPVPTDLTTAPSTWSRFEGSYRILDAAGRSTLAAVALEGSSLVVTFPGTPSPSNPTQTYSTTALPILAATFLIDADGNGSPESDITFIENVGAPDRPMWLRNRGFVGWRFARQDGVR